MAREKEGYRDNLELLNVRFPAHDMLTVQQIMEVTGFKTEKTVRKHLGKFFTPAGLSKATLARWMCG